MKKVLISLIAFAVLASQAACAAAATSAPATSAKTPAATAPVAAVPAAVTSAPALIGVFDVNQVIAESPKIKELQEQLNKKGQEITAQLAEIKSKVTPEQYTQRQEVAYNVYLQMKQDYEKQMDATVKLAVAQVATEKNLSLVVYKNAVAYGGLDITADVIKKLR